MEHKTISHLNGKVWYRLLKVLYFGAFVLIALLTTFIAYIAQDIPSQYIISCSWNGRSFVDGVVYADEYFTTDVATWSASDRLAAGSACLSPSDHQIFDAQAQYDMNTNAQYKGTLSSATYATSEEIAALSSMGINVWDNDAFKVTTPIQTRAGIIRFLEIAILALLIEVLIFEAIRRIFYYIVLGSIKPEK